MSKWFGVLAVLTTGLTAPCASAAPPNAIFDWVDYQGIEAGRPETGQYRNPIIPGFHPDPSIVRAGKEYYLVNSSFGFFPGIPVFHSRDLVGWTQIGNALDRPGQIDLGGMGSQRGIFAPAITHHKGLFYIIGTCVDCGGNFVITSDKAEGPWSKPHWLGFEGIDPSLFIDRDGRGWIVNNGAPDGTPAYEGHRAIWIQQFDLQTLTMTGPRKVLVNGGVDFSKKPIWIEGPHIFRVNGYYYLTAAEGGTAADHSQTIFRSRNVTGPYLPGPQNPILTQRNLDPARSNPVTATGHADLVRMENGKWAAVFLGNRPYQGWLTNIGRETFLLPVRWQDGWPEILPQGKSVPLVAALIRPTPNGQTDWSRRHDDFDAPLLGPDWLSLRAGNTGWLSLSDPNGALSLIARNEPISGLGFPSFVGLRQRHHRMFYSTSLHFTPRRLGDKAGLVAFADEAHFFFFGLERLAQGSNIVVRSRNGADHGDTGALVAVSATPVPDGTPLTLRISADGPAYSFAYRLGEGAEIPLLQNADGRILATEYSGLLFTATIIGPYAAREPHRTPGE